MYFPGSHDLTRPTSTPRSTTRPAGPDSSCSPNLARTAASSSNMMLKAADGSNDISMLADKVAKVAWVQVCAQLPFILAVFVQTAGVGQAQWTLALSFSHLQTKNLVAMGIFD